jgi:hypothetical protein
MVVNRIWLTTEYNRLMVCRIGSAECTQRIQKSIFIPGTDNISFFYGNKSDNIFFYQFKINTGDFFFFSIELAANSW